MSLCTFTEMMSPDFALLARGVRMMTEQDRATSALMHIDSGCPRDEWVKIGMAAKAAGLGFDDFHSWSACAGNYAGEQDCRNVWKSFSSTRAVTANSLFGTAYALGWRDPSKHHQGANAARAGISIAAPTNAPVTPTKRVENAKAAEVWGHCESAPTNHAYIARKSGLRDGLRIYPHEAPRLVIRGENVSGWLVVPCRDLDGHLQTLQFIPPQGDKLNLPGASFGSSCYVVGEITDRVYVVEGIGQAWAVHAATNDAAVVCFGAGRMATVAAAIREQHPTARLVLVPDRGKECQAAEIARALNGAWCELPQDKASNYDAHDYAFEHGIDALAALLECAKMSPMRFKLLTGAELSNIPPMRWMVRGVLPMAGLAALYGPSGCGKSFMVLSLAAAIAGDASDWFGRRVVHCPVTYCALEGEAGMGKRVAAWCHHERKPVPDSLRFIIQAFDLLNADDLVELAKAIQAAGGSGGLIILDTLNRAAPGADENSSVDMGNIIAASKQLQSLTGGLVLLVHHTGKDATKGLRGHSSLYAALDGAIEVTKTDTRREWSIAKSKDDETGAAHAFKLEVVQVAIDDDGDEITSCVAVRDDSVDAVRRARLPSGGNQKIALDTLGEPLRKSTEFNKDGAPHGHPCIRLDEAVDLIAERLTCEAKRRTERAQQALTALVAKQVYGVKGVGCGALNQPSHHERAC